MVGFNDEIVDATFLNSPGSSSHTHLALAANSNLVRIYSTSTFDARLLSGHRDMVLCLDKSIDYRLLASGSKDRTARVWASTEQGEWRCVAVCEGHAETVGAIAMSRKLDDKGQGRFMITASQDRTLKMWDLTPISASTSAGATPVKPKSLATLRAHEKDINSLDLSPNDRFLASGSQDKLVKIFEVDFTPSASGPAGALKLVGTCKGHRRGVWTVKFSRTDRIVASGAADRTIKLWSLDDFTCLKVSDSRLAGPKVPSSRLGRPLRATRTPCCESTSFPTGCSSSRPPRMALSNCGISRTKNASRPLTTTKIR